MNPSANEPPPQDPQSENPSVEASKIDEALVKKQHEEAEVAGMVAGTGLGCLGFFLLPWTMIGLSIVLAMVFILVWRLVH